MKSLALTAFTGAVMGFNNGDLLAQVTHKRYFDIKVGEKELGRITFGLFGNVVPKTVANFVDICDGVTEMSPPNPEGSKRSYDGTEIFRVIP